MEEFYQPREKSEKGKINRNEKFPQIMKIKNENQGFQFGTVSVRAAKHNFQLKLINWNTITTTIIPNFVVRIQKRQNRCFLYNCFNLTIR